MKTEPTIEAVFAPLIGQLVWAVEGGFGTFITLEFGSPHLRIEEPITASRSASDRVRRNLARRRVFPTGDWHLWIQSGEWSVTTVNGSTSSDEETDNWWKERLDDVSGQRLLSVESAEPGRLALRFDLGGLVEVGPGDIERDNDVWTLYPWTGDIVGCRPDGTLVVSERNAE